MNSGQFNLGRRSSSITIISSILVSILSVSCGGGGEADENDEIVAANAETHAILSDYDLSQESTLNSYISATTRQIISSGGRVSGVIEPMTASYYIEMMIHKKLINLTSTVSSRYPNIRAADLQETVSRFFLRDIEFAIMNRSKFGSDLSNRITQKYNQVLGPKGYIFTLPG